MRVAALLPAATDIMIALGAGDRLVAVTHACVLPGPLARLPRVTRSRIGPTTPGRIDTTVQALSESGAALFEIDEARLAALRPDLILTQAVCAVCAVREADVRAFAARQVPAPVVTTLGASTVDGVLADVRAVAAAAGLPDEGDELVAGLRTRMSAVHAALRARSAPRPRVAVIEWTDPPYGAGHWVPDQVRRAGGADVLGRTGEPSRRTAPAEVHAQAPDVIVVAPCGIGLDDAVAQGRTMLAAGDWAWARGVPAWALDANALTSSPGPGVVRGIEVLARILHPGIFGEPDPRTARPLGAA